MLSVLVVALRLPADWIPAFYAWVYQFDTPENLVAALAGFISLLIVALAFSVKAYIAQRDKFDAFAVAMLEKSLTTQQENKRAIDDNTELVKIIAEELRTKKRGENRGRNTKAA